MARTGRRHQAGDMKTLTSKIRSHADVVGMIPHILGYVPEDSLVLVTVVEEAGHTVVGPCIRINFGYREACRLGSSGRSRIVRLVEEAGAVVQLIPVLFSADIARAHGDGTPLASATLFDQLSRPVLRICDDLYDAGYRLFNPLWTGGSVIGSIGEPGILQTLDDAQASAPVAEMVASGSAVSSDFGQAAALPPTDDSVAAAAAKLCDTPLRALIGPVVQSLVALYDVAVRVDDCGHDISACITPAAIAGVEHMVAQKWSRDGLLMLLSFDHPDFPIRWLREECRPEFLDQARPLFESPEAALEIIGLARRRPDIHLTDYAVAYLKAMAAHCSPRATPMLLAVLGWMEWARGKNSFAEHYAQIALTVEPDNVLARLVSVSATEGMLPHWLRSPS